MDLLKPWRLTNPCDLDSPSTTEYHRQLIIGNKFLSRIYRDIYEDFLTSLPDHEDRIIVEIGSGASFIKELAPDIITSEILQIDNVDVRFTAMDMPFKENSLDAIFMMDVFHHLPSSGTFLNECLSCLKPGGSIYMVEPAVTLFSKLIYKHLHHEPFDDKAGWNFKTSGPLSGSNIAQAWIVFKRDFKIFKKSFPQLKIDKLNIHTPFRYLASGGLSYRPFLPAWSYDIFKLFETLISPLNPLLGMFMTVKLTKSN